MIDDRKIANAYEMQDAMVGRYLQNGFHLSGMKIGLTGETIQRKFGVSEPNYGYIFSECLYANFSETCIGGYMRPMVEPELAFILKDDLYRAEVTETDVMDATDYVLAAFEIVDIRTGDGTPDIADSIADNARFAAYVLGDVRRDVKDIDFTGIRVRMYSGNALVSGTGSNVMGNPLSSVAWLARKMVEQGKCLKAGDCILSGSMTAAMRVNRNETVSADFEGLGKLCIAFV